VSDIDIRDATADDGEVLKQIGAPLFGADEQHRAQWLDGWPRPGDLGAIAEIDEIPVGVAWCRTLPSPFRFEGEASLVSQVSLRVENEHRRQGIATVLMTRLVEAAREAGIRGLGGQVLRGNQPARRVCEKVGLKLPIDAPPLPGSVWVWLQLRDD
jgi:GNAT superfamily N-acetyltransferase